jgi:hypothetical protein
VTATTARATSRHGRTSSKMLAALAFGIDGMAGGWRRGLGEVRTECAFAARVEFRGRDEPMVGLSTGRLW